MVCGLDFCVELVVIWVVMTFGVLVGVRACCILLLGFVVLRWLSAGLILVICVCDVVLHFRV